MCSQKAGTASSLLRGVTPIYEKMKWYSSMNTSKIFDHQKGEVYFCATILLVYTKGRRKRIYTNEIFVVFNWRHNIEFLTSRTASLDERRR
jgi:hypothetical protein